MIDKPDPAKDAGRTDSPAAKRPHATLDLKATEVRPPSPPAGASSTASAASASSSAGSTSQASAAPGGPAPAAKSAASASSTEPPGKSPAANPTPKAPAAAKGEPQVSDEPSRGGGFFSHLFAGVIGGGLALAGVSYLGPQVTPPTDTGAARLEARIAALETAPNSTPDLSGLAAKIDDTESRLAKLDQIEQSVTALRDAQSTVQAETQALNEAAQRGDGAKVSERLSKLEEQLAMIAQSAPGSDGHVPQLTAITGKISDLESSLATQVGALRKSLPSEVEERLAATAEASEAAKAATTRLDRDVAQVRTDQARVAQKLEAAKADSDRFSASLEAVKEEAGRLSGAIGDLKSSLDSQIKLVAKPADVSAAVAPVATKLAELEQNVGNVVKSEQSRKENAERIVLSLELANLKRALDRGQGYAAELAEVRKASGGKLDLTPLERFRETGVATPADLKAEFRPVMNAVIDAESEPADGSVIDRLLSGAKSVVRVRKISPEAGDASAEAVVARIEAALGADRLGDVIEQAKTLPDRARGPIDDWLQKVTARHSVDVAIGAVEDQLKASLSGVPEAQPATPASPNN